MLPRELNIEYVDLLPSFRNITTNGKVNLFRKSDKHWNERGHTLAAKNLYFALVKRNLLNHVDEALNAKENRPTYAKNIRPTLCAEPGFHCLDPETSDDQVMIRKNEIFE